MAKNEVAKTGSLEVGTYDYGEQKHAGFEDVKVTDLSIPFISVMQSNSKLVGDPDHPAKAGDMVNSVTGEVVKQPMIVHPVHKDHLWVEWIPRNKGGGRGDSYEDDSPIVKEVIRKNGGSRIPPLNADGERKPFRLDNGMDLVETHYVYCLIMNDEGTEHMGYCVLPFSSTKIKVQKDWWTAMYTLKGAPPLVANRARVSTVQQTGNGQQFFNLSIKAFGDTWLEGLIPPDEAGLKLMREATEFREMIESGLAKAAVETEDTGSSSGSDGGGSSPSSDDDDTPF
jgi:hypothetical protein